MGMSKMRWRWEVGAALGLWIAAPSAFAQDWGAVIGPSFQLTAPTTGATLHASSEASTQASQQAGNTRTDCRSDSDCGPDSACHLYASGDQVCVPRAEGVPVSHPVEPATCSDDRACAPGSSCSNGRCLSAPPVPPSVQLLRRGSELFLRDRAVQLREELALGRGPVISGLAAIRGLPPATLGRTIRTHGSELRGLIGAGDSWASTFLARIDALCTEGA